MVITVVKYIPQAWRNYERKSTVGWSIIPIIMDVLGATLSISQLVIDSSLQKDWSGLTGNPVKLGIGNISIIFDLVCSSLCWKGVCVDVLQLMRGQIFMIQHYILYPSVNAMEGERERLLGSQIGQVVGK